MDLVIKGLSIEQKEEKLQKVYQRFVKEEDIASEEYHDTLNIIISDILYQFLDGYENPKYKYFEKEIKELLSVYNYIKVNTETLAIPQKELDFIIFLKAFFSTEMFSLGFLPPYKTAGTNPFALSLLL